MNFANSNAEGAEGNGFQITNYQLEISNSLPPPSPYPVTIETPLWTTKNWKKQTKQSQQKKRKLHESGIASDAQKIPHKWDWMRRNESSNNTNFEIYNINIWIQLFKALFAEMRPDPPFPFYFGA